MFLRRASFLVVAGLVAVWIGCKGREAKPVDSIASESEAVSAFHIGVAAMQIGQLDHAERELTRAAKLAPNEPSIYVNLGLVNLRRGDADAAAQLLEKARTLAPSNFEVALVQGHVEHLRGKLEEAAAHLRRALAAKPGDAKAGFELVKVLGRIGGVAAESEARRQLEAIHEHSPHNLAILVERARAAVRRSDAETLRDSLARMAVDDSWPSAAVTQVRALQDAARKEDFREAARSVAFLRNVLAQLPAFRRDLREIDISADSGARPLDSFLVLKTPAHHPDPPDTSLSFAPEPSDSKQIAIGNTALDWNHDFLMDVASASERGWRLALADSKGGFSDVTSRSDPSFGVWTADIEMDGDLDLIVGRIAGSPLVARNNGDGTIEITDPFPGVSGLRAFVWADLDDDADPDAVLLDESGQIHFLTNEQAGRFTPLRKEEIAGRVLAIALADTNNDGRLELLTLDDRGSLRRTSIPLSPVTGRGQGEGSSSGRTAIAMWNEMPPNIDVGRARLAMADLDNNGALDLIASSPAGSRIWLSDAGLRLNPFNAGNASGVVISDVVDTNDDGRLDLVGLTSGRPVVLANRGTAKYHWQVIQPRARTEAGDQRINSFGVGGEIEVRSGLLAQKQFLTGAPIHIGLGTRARVDVARILWPNGVMQAEFELKPDQTFVAEQRLKGSCPWVFAWNGERMQFVTDFIWRSPLGLRINAQDTAANLQTADRVKIRGDQLVPNDRGVYDIRISAELWETHFFDHVSLMTVDHPPDTEVFIDERFARERPSLELHATGPTQSVARAFDDASRDVTNLIRERDGRHVGTFERGPYQGVAKEHFIEIDLGDAPPRDKPLWLLAYGFVYPTDSSINVAMGQGEHPRPHGLAVEVLNHDGKWIVARPDIGFPSGKNKTILIDLRNLFDGPAKRRLRLRTNLEVYWDWIGWAVQIENPTLETMQIAPATALLRYRGFSQTHTTGRDHPDTPDYDRISNTTQRWRDLVGYYTRFGDIRELLASVDDRYVIMNAGDEMTFEFPAPPKPREGWVRDFVLIGDGWVKDGDYNTAYSRTVGPLPSHSEAEYTGDPKLENDPIYRRFPRDWETYHTRYVGTEEFVRSLHARAMQHP